MLLSRALARSEIQFRLRFELCSSIPFPVTITVTLSERSFGKGMNPSFLLSSNGIIEGQTELFKLCMATCLEEDKL